MLLLQNCWKTSALEFVISIGTTDICQQNKLRKVREVYLKVQQIHEI